MAGVSDKSRFDKSFLRAALFGFKQCGHAFSPKSEQLDAIVHVQCVSLPFRMCAITFTGLKQRLF